MRKAIVYLTVLLLLMGVTQAVSEEQGRVNNIVVDSIDGIHSRVQKTLEDKSTEHINSLSEQSVNITYPETFRIFLMIFCLCMFLIPAVFSIVRLKLNEKKIKFYMDNNDFISK